MRTKRISRRITVVLVASVVMGMVFARSAQSSEQWNPPRVVTIELDGKNKGRFSSLWSSNPWAITSSDGKSGQLLLRDGDYLLGPVDDMLIPYLESDGTTLRVTFNEWSMRLGDEIVSLSLKESEASEWLTEATDQELATLRFVVFPDDIEGNSLPEISRLAAVNRGLGISVTSLDALLTILPLFQTRTLMMSEVQIEGYRPEVRKVLVDQTQIEMLMMDATDYFSLDFLPDLPRLRRLWIEEWDVKVAGPLPEGLAPLRSLAVNGTLENLFALSTADGLEELIIGSDEPIDLTGLADLRELNTLRLFGGWSDPSALSGVEDLRWLALPESTTQEDLEWFVGTYPTLEVLEMVGTEKVIDLSPLCELPGLEVLFLVLDRPLDDGEFEVLGRIRSLHYLAISEKESPERMDELRKALPDTLITPVGLCLGSGWILLLVPAVALFWLLSQRRRWEGRGRCA